MQKGSRKRAEINITYMNVHIFKTVALAAAAFLLLSCGQRKDPSLILNFNFQDVQGNVVKDASGSGADAILMNGAKVADMGGYKILHLAEETSYMDMGVKAGEMLSTLEDFTVSVYYSTDINPRFPGYGYFVWMFSTEEFCGPETGRYFAYRINEQRVETSVGGYNNESIIMKRARSETGRWIHVLYSQAGQEGVLYIDGEKIGTNDSMPVLKQNFTQAPTFNWLGRPAFRGDNYLHDSFIADFRIYSRALESEEIEKLAAFADQLNSI